MYATVDCHTSWAKGWLRLSGDAQKAMGECRSLSLSLNTRGHKVHIRDSSSKAEMAVVLKCAMQSFEPGGRSLCKPRR